MSEILIVVVLAAIGFVIFKIWATKKPRSGRNKAHSASDGQLSDAAASRKTVPPPGNNSPFSTYFPQRPEATPFIGKLREVYADTPLQELNDMYFGLLEKIQSAKKQQDFGKMLEYSQMSLPLIEPLIIHTVQSYGAFDLTSIPAIEYALPHYAVSGIKGQLANIREIVFSFPELDPWRDAVEKAERMAFLASRIYKFVRENPGTLQRDLKKHVQCDDGRLVANVVYYMTLLGKLHREKQDKTYKLTAVTHDK